MTKLTLDIHEDAVAVINKIKNLNDSGVELEIPEGSVLFDNILNLKLVKKYSDKLGVVVQFTTTDQLGNTLLDMLEERDGAPVVSSMPEEEFETVVVEKKERKPRISLLNKFKFNVKLPEFNWSAVMIPAVLLVVGILYILIASKVSKAYAKIVVGTEPLVRSVTVKVSVSQPTSVEGKILNGSTLSASIENTDVMDTTGEKLTGKKATGQVILYNSTDNEIKLKKGSKIAYKKDDKLEYLTDTEITVPKATSTKTTEGSVTTTVTTAGEVPVAVTAADIGSTYNIAKNSDMEIDGYKSSEMTGKTKNDLTGGKSSTVKVVAEADKAALSLKLLGVNTNESTPSLEKALKPGQKLIAGSTSVVVSGETFSYKVGDETDKLQLSQMASVKGLVYVTADLDKLIDKLSDNLIPAGYKPSDKPKEVKAEVLGNVSAAQEAEIQATVKTYITPDVDVDKIKQMLVGKTPDEAQRILGSIRNIKTYEFNLSPALPLFKKVPKDVSRINVEIEVQ